MNWLKIEDNMPDKTEVWTMGEALGIDPDAVAGKLIRVWGWASANCPVSGRTNVRVLSIIDRHSGVTGFSAAMVKVGWLLIEGDEVIFPNFERHNSQSAKQRALDSERKRADRLASRPVFVRLETGQKPAREEKSIGVAKATPARVKKTKEVNPEHAAFVPRFCAYYATRHSGTPYPFNGRDAKAVTTLLAHFHTADGIAQFIARVHKRSVEGYPFTGAETLYDIANGLARLEAALATPKGGAAKPLAEHNPADTKL